jgi:hypothetical protein
MAFKYLFRFAKIKPDCLELWSKTFQSFLVIISVVRLLALMVHIENLTDSQHIRLTDYLLEHLANGELTRGTSVLLLVKPVPGYGKGGVCHTQWF